MSSTAELIKERLSITDVVGSYIKLESAGANFKAKCPFHNERSPSFFVSPVRGSYYCFGCSAKGDIFSFVQEYEKLDFLGALKILAEKAGVELQEFKSEHHTRQERQYKVIDLACKFFEQNLAASAGAPAKKYLTDRGLTDETIKSWRVGFAIDDWRTMLDFMIRQKVDGRFVDDQDLLDVGLIKKPDAEAGIAPVPGTREKVYDRFRGRIMFPIFDSSGRVIAFSGRIFGKEEKGADGEKAMGPKYLNSPDMELFNKSEALYGFDRAKQGMREWGYGVLVEGQMDLLMCHQIGVKNAVATSGTALTTLHLQKVARMTKNIAFMYDGDNAGFNATRRGERLAIELGFDVKVVTLPEGEDPASLIQKDKQLFIKALKHSSQVIEYHLGMLLKKYPNQHDLLKAIEEHLVPDIALTPSAIRRAELISITSIKSKIPEKALTEEVEKKMQTLTREHASLDFQTENDEPYGTHTGRDEKTSNNHVGAGGLAGATFRASAATAQGLDITLRRSVALLLYIESLKGGEKLVDIDTEMRNMLSEEDMQAVDSLRANNRDELLFEAEMLFGAADVHEKHLRELLLELEDRSLKGELSRLMAELSLAEKVKDKVKSDEIIQKCQEISLKLSELNRKRQTHFKR